MPTLLNNLNAESEIFKNVIANIETSTLLGLKRIMKNYFLDKYSYFCHIPDCYICEMTMTMTMTMKISLFDINHLNTMIRENKAEKNNVVNEQETIQNNIKCRYRRPTP